MKFNPLTNDIYTHKDEFVKTMHCPYQMNWDSLETINPSMRKCAACNQSIVDTAYLTDDYLLKMVKENPATCLKIDVNQPNIQIETNGSIEQK